MEIGKIIEENNRRNQQLDRFYNPLTGEGSLIKRQKVEFSDFSMPLFLPVNMLNVDWVNYLTSFKALSDAAKELEITEEAIHFVLSNIRFEHDFEYWAAANVKIKPKDGGDLIPFYLNQPQQKMLQIIWEEMVLPLLPIRIILLKSRQFGGSTFIDIFSGYIQVEHKTNWNSLIAAHHNTAAKNVRFMFDTVADNYPKELDSFFTLKRFENTDNVKMIPERRCKITIGSIEKPDSIRADDVAMAHLTEVGVWKKTDGKKPEDLCQSILGTIPTVPWSLYAVESTAKGIGNYFHRLWQGATAGTNAMRPIFIPWMEDPKNRMPFRSQKEMNRLANTLSDYERKVLWEEGATLEGIKFYRYKLAEMNGNEWSMKSEFPTTAEEAFQASGQKVFSPSYTKAIEQDCRDPYIIGDVFADANSGPKALENCRIDKTDAGNLRVWALPDYTVDMQHRYCAFADIGGRTDKADWSVIKVFDRYPMLEGGNPEVVAVWHGHLDQDLFAWKCAQIAHLYCDALLAIEVNSLNKEETEGNHYLTILDEIAKHYKNLYIREQIENVDGTISNKYGFHTNSQSKTMIINTLNAAMRERMNKDQGLQEKPCYYERDIRAVDECKYYEVKQNGSYGAVEGQHDDHVIVTAGGVWLALSAMPKPFIVQHHETKRRRPNSHASF